MTNKPFKVLSTTALAAALMTSAIIPVAAAQTPAETAVTVTDVIVTHDSKEYLVDVNTFLELKVAGKSDPVKYVKSSSGKTYLFTDYIEAKEASDGGKQDDAFAALATDSSFEKDVIAGNLVVGENGEVKYEDPTPVVLEVKSVSVVNATTLTVTLSDDSVHTVTLEEALLANTATDVTFTIDSVKYTQTVTFEVAAEALTVESVMAINPTGVDVTITALAEAKEGVTIEVKDNTGAIVEVKPVNLVKGETVASFTFTKALTDAPKGVWTVAGISVDLDLKANLEDVYSYTNQVTLLEGLNKLALTDVDADNIVKYADAIDKLKNVTDKENYVALEDFTKAVAQEAVKAGNKAAAESKDEVAVVKAVNEAKTEVALLNALASFDRVNADWITAYDSALGTTETSIKSIQGKIDGANNTKLTSGATSPVTKLNLDGANNSVVKKDLTDAKALVTAYMIPDAEGANAKSELLREIDVQLAVVSVLEAQTPAQLTVAINGLKAVDAAFVLNMDNYKDANRTAYIKELKDEVTVTNKNTVTAINAKLILINNAEAATPIANVKAKGTFLIAAPTATEKAELLAALKAADLKNVADVNADAYATLADASAATKNAFGEITISGTLATDKATVQALVEKANLAAIQAATDGDKVYAALVAYGNAIKDLSINNKAQYFTDVANYVTDKATVQLAVDASNIEVLQAQTTAAGVLAKLQIMTQVKNVKAENAPAYLAGVLDTGTAASLGNATTDLITEVQTAVDAINTAQAAKTGVKAINEATTASALRDILTDLVVNGDVTAASYLNLTNADKLLVSELFLDDDVFVSTTGLANAARTSVDVNGDYTTLANVGTDLAKLATAFDKLRTDTNAKFATKAVGHADTSIANVQAELTKLVKANYTAYDTLTGTQKLAAAEAFIAAFPVNADGDTYLAGYTTFGAYTAAVDAAIAASK